MESLYKLVVATSTELKTAFYNDRTGSIDLEYTEKKSHKIKEGVTVVKELAEVSSSFSKSLQDLVVARSSLEICERGYARAQSQLRESQDLVDSLTYIVESEAKKIDALMQENK